MALLLIQWLKLGGIGCADWLRAETGKANGEPREKEREKTVEGRSILESTAEAAAKAGRGQEVVGDGGEGTGEGKGGGVNL